MRTPTPWLLPTEPTGTRQLLAIGISKEMLITQLRTGRLLRLRRGVYLTRSAWPDDGAGQHLLLAQAELVAHPGAVLSHQSAAVAWNLPAPGLPRWHERSPSITLPAGGGHRTSRGPIGCSGGFISLPDRVRVTGDRDRYLICHRSRVSPVDLLGLARASGGATSQPGQG